MPRPPVISGRELIKALSKRGYHTDHQRGSHVTFRLWNPPHTRLMIPLHPVIAKGTLRAILYDAGMTVEELLELL